MLIGTSFVKNKSREIEKKITVINKKIIVKEKDFYESQLDFYYLTSPSMIEKKINHLDKNQYMPMEFSNIFLSMSNFDELQKKFVIQKKLDEKKTEKK